MIKMDTVIPLFKSHYSLGRSILTCNEAGDSEPNSPVSILDLAVENGLKEVFLVEDGMSGFLQAFTNCRKAGINLRYGVRISVCKDIKEKSEDELAKTSKIVIFFKNNQGYYDFLKLWTEANKEEHFYYEPRLDYATIKRLWTKNLILAIPFYDSFLFKNLFTFSTCVPDYEFTTPIFFTENNGLIFDEHLKDKVESFCDGRFSVIPAKSIYYAKRDDFLVYLTFRCINNRSTLEKPELEHMSSDEFCLESWKELNVKNIQLQKST
jgi:DNA polymerase III alpha subunit